MKIENPPFTITYEMLSLVSSIMEKIGKLNAYDNLSKYPKLRKQNRIMSIQSSCAIEANSLSFDQVNDVINGVSVMGPKKDILEVQNAIKAYEFIEGINCLDQKKLKEIQGLFSFGLVNIPGEYRTGEEGVIDENGNVIFIAPPGHLVSGHMDNLFEWLKKEYKNINPLILSSIFHYEFVFIHPFPDFNGRTARYWQTAILGSWKPIFYWLPIEGQIYKHQNKYYEAINKSNGEGNSTFFVTFMLKMIDETVSELINNTHTEDYSLSIYTKKLLDCLKTDVWYSSNEILKLLNLKSKETLRKNYINPAIESGLLFLEFPNVSTSKKQRYKIKKLK